jgi:hypothetical protein
MTRTKTAYCIDSNNITSSSRNSRSFWGFFIVCGRIMFRASTGSTNGTFCLRLFCSFANVLHACSPNLLLRLFCFQLLVTYRYIQSVLLSSVSLLFIPFERAVAHGCLISHCCCCCCCRSCDGLFRSSVTLVLCRSTTTSPSRGSLR